MAMTRTQRMNLLFDVYKKNDHELTTPIAEIELVVPDDDYATSHLYFQALESSKRLELSGTDFYYEDDHYWSTADNNWHINFSFINMMFQDDNGGPNLYGDDYDYYVASASIFLPEDFGLGEKELEVYFVQKMPKYELYLNDDPTAIGNYTKFTPAASNSEIYKFEMLLGGDDTTQEGNESENKSEGQASVPLFEEAAKNIHWQKSNLSVSIGMDYSNNKHVLFRDPSKTIQSQLDNALHQVVGWNGKNLEQAFGISKELTVSNKGLNEFVIKVNDREVAIPVKDNNGNTKMGNGKPTTTNKLYFAKAIYQMPDDPFSDSMYGALLMVNDPKVDATTGENAEGNLGIHPLTEHNTKVYLFKAVLANALPITGEVTLKGKMGAAVKVDLGRASDSIAHIVTNKSQPTTTDTIYKRCQNNGMLTLTNINAGVLRDLGVDDDKLDLTPDPTDPRKLGSPQGVTGERSSSSKQLSLHDLLRKTPLTYSQDNYSNKLMLQVGQDINVIIMQYVPDKVMKSLFGSMTRPELPEYFSNGQVEIPEAFLRKLAMPHLVGTIMDNSALTKRFAKQIKNINYHKAARQRAKMMAAPEIQVLQQDILDYYLTTEDKNGTVEQLKETMDLRPYLDDQLLKDVYPTSWEELSADQQARIEAMFKRQELMFNTPIPAPGTDVNSEEYKNYMGSLKGMVIKYALENQCYWALLYLLEELQMRKVGRGMDLLESGRKPEALDMKLDVHKNIVRISSVLRILDTGPTKFLYQTYFRIANLVNAGHLISTAVLTEEGKGQVEKIMIDVFKAFMSKDANKYPEMAKVKQMVGEKAEKEQVLVKNMKDAALKEGKSESEANAMAAKADTRFTTLKQQLDALENYPQQSKKLGAGNSYEATESSDKEMDEAASALSAQMLSVLSTAQTYTPAIANIFKVFGDSSSLRLNASIRNMTANIGGLTLFAVFGAIAAKDSDDDNEWIFYGVKLATSVAEGIMRGVGRAATNILASHTVDEWNFAKSLVGYIPKNAVISTQTGITFEENSWAKSWTDLQRYGKNRFLVQEANNVTTGGVSNYSLVSEYKLYGEMNNLEYKVNFAGTPFVQQNPDVRNPLSANRQVTQHNIQPLVENNNENALLSQNVLVDDVPLSNPYDKSFGAKYDIGADVLGFMGMGVNAAIAGYALASLVKKKDSFERDTYRVLLASNISMVTAAGIQTITQPIKAFFTNRSFLSWRGYVDMANNFYKGDDLTDLRSLGEYAKYRREVQAAQKDFDENKQNILEKIRGDNPDPISSTSTSPQQVPEYANGLTYQEYYNYAKSMPNTLNGDTVYSKLTDQPPNPRAVTNVDAPQNLQGQYIEGLNLNNGDNLAKLKAFEEEVDAINTRGRFMTQVTEADSVTWGVVDAAVAFATVLSIGLMAIGMYKLVKDAKKDSKTSLDDEEEALTDFAVANGSYFDTKTTYDGFIMCVKDDNGNVKSGIVFQNADEKYLSRSTNEFDDSDDTTTLYTLTTEAGPTQTDSASDYESRLWFYTSANNDPDKGALRVSKTNGEMVGDKPAVYEAQMNETDDGSGGTTRTATVNLTEENSLVNNVSLVDKPGEDAEYQSIDLTASIGDKDIQIDSVKVLKKASFGITFKKSNVTYYLQGDCSLSTAAYYWDAKSVFFD
ncbi:hypothetical protein [Microscilla marina]|uniref:Uncharacterized protein n=1 Tax=Microscilla marina ATCC 23134 TaxID=313606 RepID=A1ZUL8_MICM2|nr:hypothetical protein [Microscilla marina]EAY25904.1 hypothetical protein M23134_00858 [Microscilla marina ATCC 23134]